MLVPVVADEPENDGLELSVVDDHPQPDDESSDMNKNVTDRSNPDQCQTNTANGAQCTKDNVTTTANYKKDPQDENKTDEEKRLEKKCCRTHINAFKRKSPDEILASPNLKHGAGSTQGESGPGLPQVATEMKKKKKHTPKAKATQEDEERLRQRWSRRGGFSLDLSNKLLR